MMIEAALTNAQQSYTLPEKFRPRLSCDGVIAAKKNLCWVSAEAWDLPQVKVCEICQTKNFRLFVEIASKGDDRMFAISSNKNLVRFRCP